MITLNNEQLGRLESELQDFPSRIPGVIARAINRSADQAKTEASKVTRENYTIKHGDVLKTIRINKASTSNLEAEVISKGNALELTKFKVKANSPFPKKGKYASVSVKKGASKMISGSFVAKMSNGHVNVFTRVTKDRAPIKGHYGPSIPQMIGNARVIQAVESKAMSVLDSRLDHEINQVLRGSL